MSDSKKSTTASGGKTGRPAPEKDSGKQDGAVDDGELEGVAGGVHPVLNFPIVELDPHNPDPPDPVPWP